MRHQVSSTNNGRWLRPSILVSGPLYAPSHELEPVCDEPLEVPVTSQPGDITRQWWYLFQAFPAEHRDEEIATWVKERRVGALIALFEQDKKDALEELRSLRRRHPREYARARREHQGEDDWDEGDLDDDEKVSWDQHQLKRDRREAQNEWVENQYERFLFIVQDRSRLIDRIRDLDEKETAGDDS